MNQNQMQLNLLHNGCQNSWLILMSKALQIFNACVSFILENGKYNK